MKSIFSFFKRPDPKSLNTLNTLNTPSPEPADNPHFWTKYMEFILQKEEPLSEASVSKWHEEFVNSNILEQDDPKPLN